MDLRKTNAPISHLLTLAVGICLQIMLAGCAGIVPSASLSPSPTGAGSPPATGAGSSPTAPGGTPGSGAPPSTPSAPPQSATFIFVKNSGAGTGLQVLRFNDNGSIVPVSGTPFPYNSQSLGIAGHFLLAGPRGQIATYSDDPNSGTPKQVSTFVKGGFSAAGDDHFVYAGDENAIYGYSLLDGQLAALAGFPVGVLANPCICATPLYGSLAIRQGYLFYSTSAGHAGSSFSVQKIQADGSLGTATTGSSGAPSAAINVTPDGRFVYLADGSKPSLTVTPFDSASGKLGVAEPVGPDSLFDLGAIDPGSQFLITRQYVPTSGIGFYRIDPKTGHLTLAALSSEAGTPEAIDPSGKYLLTFENPTQLTYAIGVFAIDANTGNLSRIGSYPLGSYSNDYAPAGFIVAKF